MFNYTFNIMYNLSFWKGMFVGLIFGVSSVALDRKNHTTHIIALKTENESLKGKNAVLIDLLSNNPQMRDYFLARAQK